MKTKAGANTTRAKIPPTRKTRRTRLLILAIVILTINSPGLTQTKVGIRLPTIALKQKTLVRGLRLSKNHSSLTSHKEYCTKSSQGQRKGYELI